MYCLKIIPATPEDFTHCPVDEVWLKENKGFLYMPDLYTGHASDCQQWLALGSLNLWLYAYVSTQYKPEPS